MARFNADKIYFDELVAGIGAQVNMDAANNFDAEHNTQITGVIDISFATQKMVFKEILDIDIICTFDVDEDYSSFIDLMQMVPSKFRSSVLLQEYFQEVGTLVGTWLGDIRDLAALIDKFTVQEAYLQNLSDLLNLTILYDENTSLVEKRRQLIQVIEWYKIKGTYKSLTYIAYLLGLNINLWDLYTNDYVTFIQEPWFVGAEGVNPGGLDSTYYKSPHLGIEVLLNKVFGTYPDEYLFTSGQYSDMTTYVELARPINVVPHYALLLEPETDPTGDVVTVDGDIETCVIGDWTFTRKYFDMVQSDNLINLASDNIIDDNLDNVITQSQIPVRFDDGEFFDYTDDAFYNQITGWKLGIGNKNTPPANTGWALETIVLTGTIDDIRVYSDRVEFEFEVPNTVTQAGISELGLYLAVGDVLEVGSTFPNIDITPGITLKVLVTIQRT